MGQFYNPLLSCKETNHSPQFFSSCFLPEARNPAPAFAVSQYFPKQPAGGIHDGSFEVSKENSR
jgi:hypothetical protein